MGTAALPSPAAGRDGHAGYITGFTALSVVAAPLLPAVPQPFAYHDFADHRTPVATRGGYRPSNSASGSPLSYWISLSVMRVWVPVGIVCMVIRDAVGNDLIVFTPSSVRTFHRVPVRL